MGYSKGMKADDQSPKISRLEWGEVELEDGAVFKDVKLSPKGAREWNWKETGTSHNPGIQFVDVEELLDHGAEEVVLSRGVLGRLGVPKETIAELEARQIVVHIARTKKAVALYNQLVETKKVGALIHSTC